MYKNLIFASTNYLLEEQTLYHPFGSIITGGQKSKFTYTGQESDKESNLLYYGARYYKPELRRFLQPDPVIQNPYDPQTLNHYSYVRNNPLKYVDPTGKFLDPASLTTLFVVGTTIGLSVGIAAYSYLSSTPMQNWKASEMLNKIKTYESAAIAGLITAAGEGILPLKSITAKTALAIQSIATPGLIIEETESINNQDSFTATDAGWIYAKSIVLDKLSGKAGEAIKRAGINSKVITGTVPDVVEIIHEIIQDPAVQKEIDDVISNLPSSGYVGRLSIRKTEEGFEISFRIYKNDENGGQE